MPLRVVYISFNKDLLDNLNTLIGEAQQLYDNTAAGTELGEVPASYKTQLQAAIDLAKETGDWLAAPRPQILAATAALQSAVDAFQSAIAREVYFSAVHATEDAFSAMGSYFQNPAVLAMSEDGLLEASVTVKNSSAVPEFRVKSVGGLVDVEVVREDEAADTRVVAFPVNDLRVLLHAQVRTVVPAQNYDRTHDIRLNFNNVDNTELYELIQAAKAAERAAVEGTEPGQYPAVAKAALQTAIDIAESEATSLNASAADSAAALAMLQRALNLFNVSQVAEEVDMTKPIKNGEYRFTFTATSPGGTPIGNFVESGGTLNAVNGKKTAVFTLKPGVSVSKVTKVKDGVRTEIYTASALKKGELVTVLAADNVISFEAEDLTAAYQLELTDANANQYTFELQFVKLFVVNVPDDEDTGQPGGGNPGTGGPGGGGGGGGGPSAPSKSFNGYTDGTYTIEYRILKKGTTQRSVMMDYVKTPGYLTVTDGVQYVSFTLEQSKEVTDFEVEVNGSLTPATVIGRNEEGNTRDVQFKVADLTQKLNAWVKIEWPEMDYFHDYDIDLTFDLSSVKAYTPPSTPGAGGLATPQHSLGQPKEQNDPGGQTPAPQTTADKSAMPAATEEKFADVGNHWAKLTIRQGVALGIVNGYEDGTFRPDGLVSRNEFAVMMGRALKLEPRTDEAAFADAESIPAWARAYVAQIARAGIIGGYEDGTFRGERNISRAEMAVMIARALKLEIDPTAEVTFADAEEMPAWARPYVAAASKLGIMGGRDNNRFAPNESATRAEAATLMIRIYYQANKNMPSE